LLNISCYFILSEVDGLLDPEECDLLVAIAKRKNMKRLHQQFSPLDVKNAERLLRDWDSHMKRFVKFLRISEVFARNLIS